MNKLWINIGVCLKFLGFLQNGERVFAEVLWFFPPIKLCLSDAGDERMRFDSLRMHAGKLPFQEYSAGAGKRVKDCASSVQLLLFDYFSHPQRRESGRITEPPVDREREIICKRGSCVDFLVFFRLDEQLQLLPLLHLHSAKPQLSLHRRHDTQPLYRIHYNRHRIHNQLRNTACQPLTFIHECEQFLSIFKV